MCVDMEITIIMWVYIGRLGEIPIVGVNINITVGFLVQTNSAVKIADDSYVP